MALFKGKLKQLASKLKGKVANFKEKHPKLAAVGGVVGSVGGMVAGLIPGAGTVMQGGKLLKKTGKLAKAFGKVKGKLGGALGKIKNAVKRDGKISLRKLKKTMQENGLDATKDEMISTLQDITEETGADIDTRSAEDQEEYEDLVNQSEAEDDEEDEDGEPKPKDGDGFMKKVKRWYRKLSKNEKIFFWVGVGVGGVIILGFVLGEKTNQGFKWMGKIWKRK